MDEDEIMICECRRPTDGSPGCGPDCLNRILNIECVAVSKVWKPFNSLLWRVFGSG